MGTKFWKVVCDENGIGGDGEYFGDNDAQHGRISVFYHETSGGNRNHALCSSTSSPG
jgi:hypothetical protein